MPMESGNPAFLPIEESAAFGAEADGVSGAHYSRTGSVTLSGANASSRSHSHHAFHIETVVAGASDARRNSVESEKSLSTDFQQLKTIAACGTPANQQHDSVDTPSRDSPGRADAFVQETPPRSSTATTDAAAVHDTPLVPSVPKVKGAALPQPLAASRSQHVASPTGYSSEDELSTAARGSAGSTIHSDDEDEAAEQQFVDEFGFVIDEKAKEEDEQFIRKINGKQVVRREIKWANMAADWGRTNSKLHTKLKERCRKGIPSRFRGTAWQLLLCSRTQMNSQENAGVYIALREKQLANSEVDAIISRDLARTFPTHVLFRDQGGVGQTFLRNVLHAYAGLDPEVGYVQGMGFLVAALSTQMGEEESFWALHEMMHNQRYKMRELFRPGFPLLHQFFYQLKRLMARLLPHLHKRFEELGVDPSFYASQWFLTLFVNNFPFRALLRVWDIFFSEGWKIIFRTGLALLKWEEKRLLELPFEELLPALKKIQDGKEAKEIIKRAHRVKFKTAELNRYGEEYWRNKGCSPD